MTLGKIINVDVMAGTVLIAGDDGRHYRASKQALQDELTFDGKLRYVRVCFKTEKQTALDVMKHPRSRPGTVESHSITGRGIVRHVSESSDFAFVEVPGQRRNVFLHRSQAGGARFAAGQRIRFDHLQPDHHGRPQIIGARVVEVDE